MDEAGAATRARGRSNALRTRLIAALAISAAASIGFAAVLLAELSAPKPETFRRIPVTAAFLARGAEVYASACASCHGDRLQGQPDWKQRNPDGKLPAPPHDVTGHSWHHADGDLFRIVQGGVGAIVPGYVSDMPAFEDRLQEADISAVLAYIKSTWPPRARAFQAEVTKKAGGT